VAARQIKILAGIEQSRPLAANERCHPLKLITLNIQHGGGKRAPAIASYLAQVAADIVVLTEYRRNGNAQLLKNALTDLGCAWQVDSTFDERGNAVLIAS